MHHDRQINFALRHAPTQAPLQQSEVVPAPVEVKVARNLRLGC
ncbi:MAG: hypothetical protein U0401_31145 [Anaerolineae bacterium]